MDNFVSNILVRIRHSDIKFSIFTMSNNEGNLITGNMDPKSKKDRYKLKSRIEKFFEDTNKYTDESPLSSIVGSNKTIMVSKSGNSTDYFNVILKDIEEKYPKITVRTLFDVSTDF